MLNHTQMQTYAMMKKLGTSPVSVCSNDNMYGLGIMLTDYRFPTLMQYLHYDRGQNYDMFTESEYYWNIFESFERCLVKALAKQHIYVRTHTHNSRLNRLRIANHTVSYYLDKGDSDNMLCGEQDSPVFVDLNAYYTAHQGDISQASESVTEILQLMLDYEQLEYDYVSYTDELIKGLTNNLKTLYKDCVDSLRWYDDYVYNTPQIRKQMRELYDPQCVIQECADLSLDYL